MNFLVIMEFWGLWFFVALLFIVIGLFMNIENKRTNYQIYYSAIGILIFLFSITASILNAIKEIRQ
jgi:uncharacterized membrane protein YhaH (DUF805 family)